MRESIGWFLVIMSLIVLGIFAVTMTAFRYEHERLTETQLSLWALQRWWCWAPAAAVGWLGILIAKPVTKTKKPR